MRSINTKKCAIVEINMKIAMMVRGFIETPVPSEMAYSPAGVAKNVAEGLQKRGHDVTFFGPDGTSLSVSQVETCNVRPIARTTAELDDLVSVTDLFSDYRFSLFDTVMARDMLERAKKKEFDVVIFNHYESVLPLAKLFPTVPIVYILHDYMGDARRQVIEMHTSPNQYFVSISDSQRRDAPDFKYAATIYNGIDTDSFSFEPEAEDYLMFSGRITQDKGVKEAVQVAIQSKKRLLIAGNLSKSDFWYFDEHIKPYLDDKILYLGMLDKEQLINYYKKATALLAPIQWQEPFGLTLAEANACGTPVIAFNRGAVPEVIANNKTGYIVDNSAEMIMAVENIGAIKRKDCRDHVVNNFTLDIMTKKYEKTLEMIIAEHRLPVSKRRKYFDQPLSKSFTRFSRQLASPSQLLAKSRRRKFTPKNDK